MTMEVNIKRKRNMGYNRHALFFHYINITLLKLHFLM